MMTTILNEITDQDRPHAENLTTPPALITPAATNTSATFVVPPITLHTDAGSHCFSAEVSGPQTRTSLRPLILECELAHHPDKAFVQQLIYN